MSSHAYAPPPSFRATEGRRINAATPTPAQLARVIPGPHGPVTPPRAPVRPTPTAPAFETLELGNLSTSVEPSAPVAARDLPDEHVGFFGRVSARISRVTSALHNYFTFNLGNAVADVVLPAKKTQSYHYAQIVYRLSFLLFSVPALVYWTGMLENNAAHYSISTASVTGLVVYHTLAMLLTPTVTKLYRQFNGEYDFKRDTPRHIFASSIVYLNWLLYEISLCTSLASCVFFWMFEATATPVHAGPPHGMDPNLSLVQHFPALTPAWQFAIVAMYGAVPLFALGELVVTHTFVARRHQTLTIPVLILVGVWLAMPGSSFHWAHPLLGLYGLQQGIAIVFAFVSVFMVVATVISAPLENDRTRHILVEYA